MANKNSRRFSLNKYDWIKALILAFISNFGSALVTVLMTGALPTKESWRSIAAITLGTTISYLIKQFISGSDGMPGLTKEPKNPE